MVRPELHSVRRPFYDCTSVRRLQLDALTEAPRSVDESMHLHAEMTRTLPAASPRYSDIKVALRLAA